MRVVTAVHVTSGLRRLSVYRATIIVIPQAAQAV